LNPLELVALTPKNNCGDCGHPTCLAFAVAVTKGGISALGCPHIDPATLPGDLARESAGAGLDQVARGQQERDMALVAHLKSKIRGLDFASLAERVGAKWQPERPGELAFRYLGRQVRTGPDQVSMDDRELVDPRDQILLYNYLAFGGGEPPGGEWVGMESLPNSISKVRTLDTYCQKRISERFSGRADRLAALCLALDGREETGQSADVAVVVPVLPRVPLLVLFWDEEPEDGFAATTKILFDQRVMDFLDLESLVFAAERLADRLAEIDSNE
jgi:hypothetical protein